MSVVEFHKNTFIIKTNSLALYRHTCIVQCILWFFNERNMIQSIERPQYSLIALLKVYVKILGLYTTDLVCLTKQTRTKTDLPHIVAHLIFELQ